MSDKNKELPKPPTTPFGRKKRFGDDVQEEPLLSDKMTMAMAGGKIDEFMGKEFGDNENARKLASMMMGMSGMGPGVMPQGVTNSGAEEKAQNAETPDTPDKSVAPPTEAPPEELMKAAMGGDVKHLAEILKKEHLKRQGKTAAGDAGPEPAPPEPISQEENTEGAAEGAPDSEGAIEKHILMKLIKIATDNDVSVDWVINRALKLYVRDHEGTGRI